MTKKFDHHFKQILAEAQADDSELPEFGQDPSQAEGGQPDMNDPGQSDPMDDMGLDDFSDVDTPPVPPEELELGKLAVRAANFNIHSKDVHQYSMKINDESIPFERISDYFEKTKNWKPVLRFVEWVMNKYEGSNSKWSEDKELMGKNIVDKITQLNKDKSDPAKLLDNSKRITWTRIILNVMLHADPSFNLVGTDITEENLPDIFNLLKSKFNQNSRGLFNAEIKGPNNN